jgi:hypothetical protein
VRVNEAAAFALLFDVPLGELLDAAGPGPQAAAGETERAIRERIAAEILGRHPADLGPDAEEFGQLAADDEDVAASAGVSDVLLSRTVPIRPAVTTGSDDGWFCGYP